MSSLANKRITVTGGTGFLGKYVIQNLQERGCKNIFIPTKKDYNLVEKEDVKRLYHDSRPEIVINVAARMGGIGANREKPGDFFYENLMIGVLMMEEGRLSNVDKFVAIGTVCAYPKIIPVPFKEKDLWNGYPEETNGPYGLAKKMPLVQAQAYRQQYGFNAIYLLLVNLYGPGDYFRVEISHVIPALIKKCLDAVENNDDEIVVWGTGTATREFLYVEDAAEGIIAATEKYDESEPVNIGSGFEISIKDLADLIARLTEFKGRLVWDTSKPDGQPRRLFDNSLAEKKFGFKARTNFEVGLEKTIKWYKEQRKLGLLE